ncbi:MAG TPA: RDD family protein [Chitinophagaceae bacterium]|nr:RDD family protein [Chitinophagaceae bacterium]
MSKLKILTSFNIELDFEIPDFHKRLFAWLIDLVIMIAYYIILVSFAKNNIPDWALDLLWVLIPAYPLVCELTMNGQSIGKKIMGIRVINETGGNASAIQFIIRWMLRVSDILALILIIVFAASFGTFLAGQGIEVLFLFCLIITDILCVIISRKSQRLGDMAAGTLIIDLRTKAGLEETVFMETEESYVPVYPEVMRLSDRDLNIIKSVYSTVLKKNDYALAERTAEKIESALKIHNKQHPLNFLETLLKDYNYLSTR